jgi:molybdate transport system substrate-binding protein
MSIARCAVVAAAALFAAAPAHAAEIKLIASRAVEQAYHTLLPAYEKASGNKVTVVWGGTGEIMKKIADGEAADLVIITDFGNADLIKQGRLLAAGQAVVAKSPVGVAVPAGHAKPDISSPEALKASLLKAKTVVLTQGPSNPRLHALFEKLGIADAMKGKEIQALGPGLNEAIVSGKAEMGFSQGSELFNVRGMDYVGDLPKGAEVVLTYTVAYHPKAAQPDAAKSLVAFLTAPDAAKVLKANGLEP